MYYENRYSLLKQAVAVKHESVWSGTLKENRMKTHISEGTPFTLIFIYGKVVGTQ